MKKTRSKVAPREDSDAKTGHKAELQVSRPKDKFPVVGIGASAGGLAALESFFSSMIPNKPTGITYIIVQHLAPDHKSILNELIKKYTTMEVFEIEDDIHVLPDTVYIIPPNRDLAYINNSLQLLEQSEPRGKRKTIDFFFASLAQDLGKRSICVILSGTGSDGTEGAALIKKSGGLVISQDPESAEYDGMPQSVINAGLADYILQPDEMPEKVLAYVENSFHVESSVSRHQPELKNDILKKIFVLLRSSTGHDFSHYKQSTILRRIERRMAVNGIGVTKDYLSHLQKSPNEIKLLLNDILIGVTSFFRDDASFKTLQEKVIPQLFEMNEDSMLVRVWIAGCSTGEEAYSIAILLHEYRNKISKSFQMQVFATDIDETSIQKARAGIFPESINEVISPERIKRYFIHDPEKKCFRIQKEIRDIVVFSLHDVTKDPPFSRLDLICCRNLLIYFNSDLQKRVLPLFHYALKSGGFLFLGSSESIGDFVYLFSVMDSSSKIYRSKENLQLAHLKQFPKSLVQNHFTNEPNRSVALPEPEPEGKTSLKDTAESELLKQFTPAGVLVNRLGEIYYLHGRTGLYLEPASGETGMNMLKMAREGLRPVLISSLQKSAAENRTITVENVKVKSNGDYTYTDLVLQPISTANSGSKFEKLYLVVFLNPRTETSHTKSKRKSSENKAPKSNSKNSERDNEIEALKKELFSKEKYLQSIMLSMETANEDLKSINEELQSVNEEFQSTNEELETSREELQSVNEELATVNSELQQKVSDLSRSYNDMNNLLAGTDIGTIFVDRELLIQRFTPAVTKVINLISTDVGRPIGHIVSNLLGYNRLPDDIEEVLDTLLPKEAEVQTKSGNWYILRLRPYRTTENVIEGVVITFFDITEIKKARDTIIESESIRQLAVIVIDSSDAIIVRNVNGMITAWNPSAQKLYGWKEKEAVTKQFDFLVPPNERPKENRLLLRLLKGESVKPYTTHRLTRGKKILNVIVTISALTDKKGNIYAISSTERLNRESIRSAKTKAISRRGRHAGKQTATGMKSKQT